MKFSGELTVKAPREAVFDRLKDAPFFASCVEGVHDLKELTPATYTALFDTRIAYIKFKFEVAIELTRAERPIAIEADLAARLGGIGQPVLKSKAREMERQFVENPRAAFGTEVKEAAL